MIWVYLTGWSNSDGPANFRDDVYGLDTVGEAQASAADAPPPRNELRITAHLAAECAARRADECGDLVKG